MASHSDIPSAIRILFLFLMLNVVTKALRGALPNQAQALLAPHFHCRNVTSMDVKRLLDAKSSVGMTLKDALSAENLLVVDVRRVDEVVECGGFPGSKNIPSEVFKQRISDQALGDKDRPVVLYCKKGMRAANCAEIAKTLGYVNVFPVSNTEELQLLVQSLEESGGQ